MFAGFRWFAALLWQGAVSLWEYGTAIHAALLDVRDELLATVGLPELSLGLVAGLCTLLCGENLLPCDVNQVALPRIVRAHRLVEHAVSQADLMPARPTSEPSVARSMLQRLAYHDPPLLAPPTPAIGIRRARYRRSGMGWLPNCV